MEYRNTQKQCWCFTVNFGEEHPITEDTQLLPVELWVEAFDVRYCVYQLEVGEENGTPHYQGYVEFN